MSCWQTGWSLCVGFTNHLIKLLSSLSSPAFLICSALLGDESMNLCDLTSILSSSHHCPMAEKQEFYAHSYSMATEKPSNFAFSTTVQSSPCKSLFFTYTELLHLSCEGSDCRNPEHSYHVESTSLKKSSIEKIFQLTGSEAWAGRIERDVISKCRPPEMRARLPGLQRVIRKKLEKGMV